jgi:hypothetical protein
VRAVEAYASQLGLFGPGGAVPELCGAAIRRHAAGVAQELPGSAAGGERFAERVSAEAHAPTRPAEWQRPTHHWRYVVGCLAILGCVALFVLTRGADPAAASPSAAAETSEDFQASVPSAAPALPAQKPALELAALPGAAAPVEVVASEPPAPPVAPKIVRQAPAKAAPHTRPAPTARSHQGAAPNRRAPASPRRNPKIDPDGTIDPYR